MPPLSILIADDHAVVRAGLRTLLESRTRWQVCAEAGDGRDAVEKAAQHKPHIAILDIGMPLLNGVETARQIRKASPSTEILILTMHESDDLVQQVVEAGARGYIIKDEADRVHLDAVQALSQHKPFFSTRVSEAAGAADFSDNAKASRSRLTPREREILKQMEVARHDYLQKGKDVHQLMELLHQSGVLLAEYNGFQDQARRFYDLGQDLARAHNSPGLLLASLGKRDEGRVEYEQALALLVMGGLQRLFGFRGLILRLDPTPVRLRAKLERPDGQGHRQAQAAKPDSHGHILVSLEGNLRAIESEGDRDGMAAGFRPDDRQVRGNRHRCLRPAHTRAGDAPETGLLSQKVGR